MVDQSHVAHVIENECVLCAACVEVCPEACITEDDEVFVIDPEVCTDCGDCIPACPVACILALPGRSVGR